MKGSEIIAEIVSRIKHLYGKEEAIAIAKGYITDRLGNSFAIEFNQNNLPPFFQDDLSRLEAGEPLQYVTGIQHFHGLEFRVNSRVLIPRPETEELTDWINKEIQNTSDKKVLDIGTGSGCIAITLKLHHKSLTVYASDISREALEVARINAENLDAEILFVEDSVLNPLFSVPAGFDIIVSNPPYIPLSQQSHMAINVTRYEPHTALFSPDDDPIIYYKAICDFAVKQLKADGVIYYEVHPETYKDVVNYLRITGFGNILTRNDMSGKLRFIRASRVQ